MHSNLIQHMKPFKLSQSMIREHTNSAAAHHHANVCLCLHVYCLIQNDVHKLIKATQRASDVPVGVQNYCASKQQFVSKVCAAAG